MSDILLDLFRSVQDLYARFDVEPTPDTAARMFAEEAREFHDAASRLDLLNTLMADESTRFVPDFITDAHLLAYDAVVFEAADVLFTVIGMVLASGVEPAWLEDAIAQVIAKNDAKTLDTHSVVAGKITRRPAAPD